MPDRPDAPASAQLAAEIVRPRFFVWLDVLGDPLRATTWGSDVAFSGTDDADLNGQTFEALDPQLVAFGAVKSQPGGGETVAISVSGLIGPDSALLNLLGDVTKWQGRDARLWQGVANAAGTAQGVVWAYFTGVMSSFRIVGDEDSQTVEMTLSSYQNFLSPAAGRTYLDQAEFDAADRSAEVAIAAANGTSGSGLGEAATVPRGGAGREGPLFNGVFR